MSAYKWIRSGTGHHYAHYKIRVLTATVDGKGPLYWLYDNNACRTSWGGFLNPDGEQQSFSSLGTASDPPVRDLRKAKRLVEKLVEREDQGLQPRTKKGNRIDWSLVEARKAATQ